MSLSREDTARLDAMGALRKAEEAGTFGSIKAGDQFQLIIRMSEKCYNFLGQSCAGRLAYDGQVFVADSISYRCIKAQGFLFRPQYFKIVLQK